MANIQRLLLAVALTAVAAWDTKCYGAQNEDDVGGASMQLPAEIAHMRFTQVDTNAFMACGLNDENRVVCWGTEEAEDAVTWYMIEGGNVSTFAHGDHATCLIFVDHSVRCFELRNNFLAPRKPEGELFFDGTTAVSISLWDYDNEDGSHVCILDEEGSPSCRRIDGADDDGAYTPSPPTSVRGTRIVSTPAGPCVFNGTPSAAQCWGHAMDDHPDLNGMVLYDLDGWGEKLICGVNADRHIVCWGKTTDVYRDEMDVTIDNSRGPFSRVVVGTEVVCGLTDAGDESELLCFGGLGRMAVPELKGISHLGAGGSAFCASGELVEPKFDRGWHCVGHHVLFEDYDEDENTGHQKLVVPGELMNTDFAKVDRNGYAACGILANRTVLCWGSDASSPLVQIVQLPQANDLTLGGRLACVALSTGGVKCYGAEGDMGSGEKAFGDSGELFWSGQQMHAIHQSDDVLCGMDASGVPLCMELERDRPPAEKNEDIDLVSEVTPSLFNITGVKVVHAEKVFCVLTAFPGPMHCSYSGRSLSSDMTGIDGTHDLVHDVDASTQVICAIEGVGRTVSCWGEAMKPREAMSALPGGMDNSAAPYVEIAVSENMACARNQVGQMACSGFPVDVHNVPAFNWPVLSLSAGGRGLCVLLGSLPTTTTTTETMTVTTETMTETSSTSSTKTDTTSTSSTVTSTSSTFTSSSSTRTVSSSTTVSTTFTETSTKTTVTATVTTSISSSTTLDSTSSVTATSTAALTASSVTSTKTATPATPAPMTTAAGTLSAPLASPSPPPTTSVAPTPRSPTSAPATLAPVTAAPTTAAPATAAPTTAAPTTLAPATAAPETAAPGTAAPATQAPSTTAAAAGMPGTGGVLVRLKLQGLLCQQLRADAALLAAAMTAVGEGVLAGLGIAKLRMEHVRTELRCTTGAARRLRRLQSGDVEAVTTIDTAAAGVEASQLLAADPAQVGAAVVASASQVPGMDAVLSSQLSATTTMELAAATTTAASTTDAATTAGTAAATTTTHTHPRCSTAEICVELQEPSSRASALQGPWLLAVACLFSRLL